MARSPRRRKTRRLSSPRCADDERCPPKDQTLAVARPPGEGMRLYGHPPTVRMLRMASKPLHCVNEVGSSNTRPGLWQVPLSLPTAS